MKPVSAVLFAGALACASTQPLATADAGTYREKILHTFGSGTDGANPFAALINVNGTLYGSTAGGGNSGNGTVFAFSLSSGAESIVYSFCSQQNCADGASPLSSLVLRKGLFYGTTDRGGVGLNGSFNGTLYSLAPGTGAQKVLYTFCQQQNCADGSQPFAGVVLMNGALYGTTGAGGAANWGAVYSFGLKSGVEKVLYSFCSKTSCADGQNPEGPLVNLNSVLYGTTATGGAYGCGGNPTCGTVFSLDPSTGTEIVLHSFGNGPDGRLPQASLAVANGILYGTTTGGGRITCTGFGCGTVFSIDPSTGAETVLYSFAGGADGQNPSAGLVNINGMLYGTTAEGGGAGCGGSGCGTAFSFDPNTGKETVLYAFQGGNDGSNPEACLIAVGEKLYGSTLVGGANAAGVLFELRKKR